jgi:hypothetical protein
LLGAYLIAVFINFCLLNLEERQGTCPCQAL